MTSQLLHELQHIARDRGWSLSQLCDHLGLTANWFFDVRAGRSDFSVDALAKIARTFGRHPGVAQKILYYLTDEYGTDESVNWLLPAAAPSEAPAAQRLAAHVRKRLHAYRVKFPLEALDGTGLFLVSPDTRSLRDAVEYLVADFALSHRMPLRVAAAEPLTPTTHHAVLAATLVLVERVDLITPSVLTAVRERTALNRPLVVTSPVERKDLTDPTLRTALADRIHTLHVTRAKPTS